METEPHYEIVPVGWVESPLTERAQAPRQGDEGAPPAWLAFEPRVAEAIRDLRPGTEIIVLTWLDRADRGVQHPVPRPAQPRRPAPRPGDRGRRAPGSGGRPRGPRRDAGDRRETGA